MAKLFEDYNKYREEELQAIRLVVFDFDGVFTDNAVYTNQSGEEMVKCCRSDGIGLKLLQKAGVSILVISGETNSVVVKRCEKLGINLIQSTTKLKDLNSYLRNMNLTLDNPIRRNEICYVGNDTPDLPCMQSVGFPIAVRDAHIGLIPIAKYVTWLGGGDGAVREVCDLICESKQGDV